MSGCLFDGEFFEESQTMAIALAPRSYGDARGVRMRYDLATARLSRESRSGVAFALGFIRVRSWLWGLLVGLCIPIGMHTVAPSPVGAEERRSPDRISTVIGSCGSKVKSTAIADVPAVLRSALLKELRTLAAIRVFEDSRNASLIGSGYSIDGSVTQLSRRINAQGDIEVSADVSLIVSALPGKRVVGMVSAGATVIGSATADTRFASLLLQSLQQEAIQQAVQQATVSWVESLERKNQRKANPKLVAMR